MTILFPNDACYGGTTKNGTCYTTEECQVRSGTVSGTCANGFGVCCIISISCGQTSSENCTYFESTGVTSNGACLATVCPCNNNICQFRLDFDSFVITGPSTTTSTSTLILGGVPNTGGAAASVRSQCLTDQFQVTNSGGITPPVICGINTGEHMYVSSDRSGGCNDLSFILGNSGIGTSLAARSWSIKVTQYSCDFENLPPDGCTQWFYGPPDSQTVQTYNYQGGQHLANQDQTICVRREQGNCRICWTTAVPSDFEVSGNADSMGINQGSICCSYGNDGMETLGYDCLNIPGGKKVKGTVTTNNNMLTQFCGMGAGLVTSTSGTGDMAGTVCSTRTPFYIRFRSDNYEFGMATILVGQDSGFMLIYYMDSVGC